METGLGGPAPQWLEINEDDTDDTTGPTNHSAHCDITAHDAAAALVESRKRGAASGEEVRRRPLADAGRLQLPSKRQARRAGGDWRSTFPGLNGQPVGYQPPARDI